MAACEAGLLLPCPPAHRRTADASPAAEPLTASSLLVHGDKELCKRYSPWFAWGLTTTAWFKQVGAPKWLINYMAETSGSDHGWIALGGREWTPTYPPGYKQQTE